MEKFHTITNHNLPCTIPLKGQKTFLIFRFGLTFGVKITLHYLIPRLIPFIKIVTFHAKNLLCRLFVSSFKAVLKIPAEFLGTNLDKCHQ